MNTGTTPSNQPPNAHQLRNSGEVEGNNYRLLGARDGWNYLATLITAERG
jgi:hypothetical protein